MNAESYHIEEALLLPLSSMSRVEIDRSIAEAYHYLSLALGEEGLYLRISGDRTLRVQADMDYWGLARGTSCRLCLAGLFFAMRTNGRLASNRDEPLSFSGVGVGEDLNILSFLDGMRGVGRDPRIESLLRALGYSVKPEFILDEELHEELDSVAEVVLVRLWKFIEINPSVLEHYELLRGG